MKRLIDVLFSVIALIVFSIPFLIISALLVIKEGHAIFFRQERIGQCKIPFYILKFQSMVNGVPTQTGAILRKTGLDEIPQFINVLKGDMSIVGPRALTLFDIERLHWNDKFHEERWQSKPGITGWAQIYGGQHRKTSWFWDRYYSQHGNVFVDVYIIGVSFLMNVFGKTKVRKVIFQKSNLK